VLDTLVSRPAFARALLAGIAAKKIPAADVSAFHARQIRSLNDPDLDRMLTEVWGAQRDTGPERQALMSRLRQQLTPGVLAAADDAVRVLHDYLADLVERRRGAAGEETVHAGIIAQVCGRAPRRALPDTSFMHTDSDESRAPDVFP
jgi:hypothetical protein